MKTNEAPERLYFGEYDKSVLDTYSTKESDNEVEYIRNDVFIEKACEYFAPHINDNSGGYDRVFVLEGFKKYMEDLYGKKR